MLEGLRPSVLHARIRQKQTEGPAASSASDHLIFIFLGGFLSQVFSVAFLMLPTVFLNWMDSQLSACCCVTNKKTKTGLKLQAVED